MKNIRIYKPKIRTVEYILALSFIVPYIEIRMVRDLFDYKNNGIVIPASIFIMLTITIVLTIAMKFYGKQKFSNNLKKIIYIHFALVFFISLRGMFVDDFLAFFSQLFWFTVPFYYAVTIIKCIDQFKLKSSNVGKAGLMYFILYICISAVINVQQYGFELTGAIEQSRLLSPGGGPVILGYTIVLAMSYLLSIRNMLTKISTLLGSCILTLGAIMTGSRGAIWPMMILVFLLFITNKRAKVQVLSLMLFVIGIIIINPVSFLANLVPRIMEFSGGGRSDTVINALRVFKEQSILTMMFGTGLSKCFPYQEWLSNSSTMISLLSYNTFLYNGQVLLVQPHNSYIYLLMETGFIGLSLFLTIFVKAFNIIKNQINNKQFKFLLLIFIVILNYLDSVFIIQPGSAGLWWVLLFLVIYDGEGFGTRETSEKQNYRV